MAKRRASAKRYAQAVFAIARERDELERWREDLSRIAEVFSNESIAPVFESPQIALTEKMAVLKTLLEALEGVQPLALNLANLLVAKGRVNIAGELAEEYEILLDAYKGVARAEVITAIPLEEEAQRRIAHYLSQLLGKEIKLVPRVDPTVVGGLVARVGDKVIDGSTLTRLQDLRRGLIRQAV